MKISRYVLSDLFEKEGRSLYALLVKLTFNEEVAKDLMQDLFLKLSGLKHLKKIGNLSAYAHRSAINLALDWRRKQDQSKKHLSLYGTKEPASENSSPLIDLIKKEQVEEVLDAICQLNQTSREAFVMRYIEERPYIQIGNQIGRTSHQARAICHKSMSHIRYLMEYKSSHSQIREAL